MALNLLVYVFEHILPYFLQDHFGNDLSGGRDFCLASRKLWDLENRKNLVSNKGMYSVTIFIFLPLLHTVCSEGTTERELGRGLVATFASL